MSNDQDYRAEDFDDAGRRGARWALRISGWAAKLLDFRKWALASLGVYYFLFTDAGAASCGRSIDSIRRNPGALLDDLGGVLVVVVLLVGLMFVVTETLGAPTAKVLPSLVDAWSGARAVKRLNEIEAGRRCIACEGTNTLVEEATATCRDCGYRGRLGKPR